METLEEQRARFAKEMQELHLKFRRQKIQLYFDFVACLVFFSLCVYVFISLDNTPLGVVFFVLGVGFQLRVNWIWMRAAAKVKAYKSRRSYIKNRPRV